ncbi:MAG: hypothetical protein QRY71_05385 [Candidatus Rhabdochlamydia sp.]
MRVQFDSSSTAASTTANDFVIDNLFSTDTIVKSSTYTLFTGIKLSSEMVKEIISRCMDNKDYALASITFTCSWGNRTYNARELYESILNAFEAARKNEVANFITTAAIYHLVQDPEHYFTDERLIQFIKDHIEAQNDLIMLLNYPWKNCVDLKNENPLDDILKGPHISSCITLKLIDAIKDSLRDFDNKRFLFDTLDMGDKIVACIESAFEANNIFNIEQLILENYLTVNSLQQIYKNDKAKQSLENMFQDLLSKNKLEEEAIKCFLRSGLVPNEIYIENCISQANDSILNELIEQKIDISNAIFNVLKLNNKNNEDALITLIKKGLNPNICKEDGTTILSYAVEYSKHNLVKELILHGASSILKDVFVCDNMDDEMKLLLYYPQVKERDQEIHFCNTKNKIPQEGEIIQKFNSNAYIHECYALFIKVDDIVTVLFQKDPFWQQLPTKYQAELLGQKIHVWRSSKPKYKIPLQYTKKMESKNLNTFGVSVEESNKVDGKKYAVFSIKDAYDGEGFKYINKKLHIHGHPKQSNPAEKSFIENKEKIQASINNKTKIQIDKSKIESLNLNIDREKIKKISTDIDKILNDLEKSNELDNVIASIVEFLDHADLMIEKGLRNLHDERRVSLENQLTSEKFNSLAGEIRRTFKGLFNDEKKKILIHSFKELESTLKTTQAKIEKINVPSKLVIKNQQYQIEQGLERIKSQIVSFENNSSSGPTIRMYAAFDIVNDIKTDCKKNIKSIKIAICNLIRFTQEDRVAEQEEIIKEEKITNIPDQIIMKCFEKKEYRQDILHQLKAEAQFLRNKPFTQNSNKMSILGAKLAFLKQFMDILNNYPPREGKTNTRFESYDATLNDCIAYYKQAKVILDQLWIKMDLSSHMNEDILNEMTDLLINRIILEERQYQALGENRYWSPLMIPIKYQFDKQLFILAIAFFISNTIQKNTVMDKLSSTLTNLKTQKIQARYGIEKKYFPFNEVLPLHLVTLLYELNSILLNEKPSIKLAKLNNISDNLEEIPPNKNKFFNDFLTNYVAPIQVTNHQNASQALDEMQNFLIKIIYISDDVNKLMQEKYKKVDLDNFMSIINDRIEKLKKDSQFNGSPLHGNMQQLVKELGAYKEQITCRSKEEEQIIYDFHTPAYQKQLEDFIKQQEEKQKTSEIKKMMTNSEIQRYELLSLLNESIQLFKASPEYDENAKTNMHQFIEEFEKKILQYNATVEDMNSKTRNPVIISMQKLEEKINKCRKDDFSNYTNFNFQDVVSEINQVAFKLIQPNYVKLKEILYKFSLGIHEICYYTTSNKNISDYTWNNIECKQSLLSKMNDTHIPLL